MRRDEIFALLGPNGADNTTTIEILQVWQARPRWAEVLDKPPTGFDPAARHHFWNVIPELLVSPEDAEEELSSREEARGLTPPLCLRRRD